MKGNYLGINGAHLETISKCLVKGKKCPVNLDICLETHETCLVNPQARQENQNWHF